MLRTELGYAPLALAEMGAAAEPKALGYADAIRFLRRRKWLIVTVTLMLMGLAGLTASRLPVRYAASSVLVFERSDTRLFEDLADFEREPIDMNAIETEMDVLQTRHFLGKVVDALALVEDPAFNPFLAEVLPPAERVWRELSGIASDVSAFFAGGGGAEAAKDAEVRAARSPEDIDVPLELQRERAVSSLLSATSVRRSGQSLAVSIRVEQRTPERAALIANQIGATYNEWSLELKKKAAEGAYEFFRQRASALEARIAGLEHEILEFTGRHELAADPGQDVLRADIRRLGEELAVLREARSSAQARAAHVAARSAGAGDDPAPIASAASPIIRQLRTDIATLERSRADLALVYGPRHPRMLSIDAEIDSVRASIRAESARFAEELASEIAIADARIAATMARLDELTGRERARRVAEIRRRELENSLAFERRRFEKVLDSLNTLDRQAEVLTPSARFLSSAEIPTKPSFPNIPVIAAGAGVAGAVLATFLALILEAFDTRVRGPGRASALLGAPTLASLPRIARRGFRRTDSAASVVARRPASAFAAACRAIRVGLERRRGEKPLHRVLVTCSLPGEERATVSVGLAAAFASEGRRTLLLGMDFMHGELARELGVGRGGPGVAKALAGALPAEAAIRPSGVMAGLDYLCHPDPAARPQMRLSERALAGLLEQLRSRYDVVVIDWPPLLSSPDASVAANFADVALLVVRAGETREESLQSVAEQLRMNPLPHLAIVLCDARDARSEVEFLGEDRGARAGDDAHAST